jgi:hypothetical protein
MLLPIQKLAAKNFVAIDSKISSKTASLPIQKWATKKIFTTDLEIGSHLCRCQQATIMSLPIQKSTAKLCRC